MKYGLPYKGSKNKIAIEIVTMLPKAENLYDLFAGGGAITHRALVTKKYSNIIMNDIDGDMVELFYNAYSGKYKNETRFISREDFYKLKDVDPYIKVCWSFGNNCRDYLYSPENEKIKKAFHYAIFFNDFDPMKEYGVDLSSIERLENRKEKYITAKSIIRKALKIRSELERLERHSKDYREIEIKENSVIYCDIPYINTDKYNSDFNHDEFYTWALNQKEPVFISSYWLPEADFFCIAEIKHTSSLCATATNSVTEKLFVPRTNKNIIYHNKTLFD